jgi:ATP-dependent Clp protease ATP-binding subunit ClpC
MQVMEDGRLTDSSGRVVSFKETLIVLTSNIGSTQLASGAAAGLGFNLDQGAHAQAARMQTLVKDELKAHFRPEFLNRLDDIVVRCPHTHAWGRLCRGGAHCMRAL